MMFSMIYGSTQFVPIELTETTGKDVSGANVTVAFLPEGSKPDNTTVWLAPDSITHPTLSTMLVRVMIGPGSLNLDKGRWRPWVKIQDSTETPWIASSESVLIY